MKAITNLAALLALALTVPVAAAENELVTIYGSLRPEMIIRSPKNGERARRMDDGYSRLGVKGETELGEGLRGFYKYERRVSANDGRTIFTFIAVSPFRTTAAAGSIPRPVRRA